MPEPAEILQMIAVSILMTCMAPRPMRAVSAHDDAINTAIMAEIESIKCELGNKKRDVVSIYFNNKSNKVS